MYISVNIGEAIIGSIKLRGTRTVHTKRVGKPEVQLLAIVAAFPCIDKLPTPNQAP